MKKYLKGYSAYSGVVRYRDLAYLLTTKDDLVVDGVAHSRIFTLYQGAPGGWDYDWNIASATVAHDPDEKFIAVGPTGRVLAIGGGSLEEEKPIVDGKYSPENRGPLREVRGIAGGKAYAVGVARQAYRRDGRNSWTCIDGTAQEFDGIDVEDTSFESIDGFGEDDIYSVGWEGEIWHFDGKIWRQFNGPTNLALFKVRCAGDGNVYACGQSGILLVGRGDEWTVIEQDVTVDNLRGMEWFGNTLFVATMTDVYELAGGTLKPVDFGKKRPSTCNHLSGRDGVLWSIGAKNVFQFDGKKWKEVLSF